MQVRSVFLNDSNNLRAGWRIVIFLIFQVTLSAAILGILQVFVSPPSEALMAIAYVILLLNTYVVLKFVDHRPLQSVGLPLHRRSRVEWAQGFLIGFMMISSVFAAEAALGYARLSWRELEAGTILSGVGLMLIAFVWFGFGEELLFRGYCFQTLIEGTNQYVAVAVLSILFGVAHLENPNVTSFGVINTVLAGVWLSVAYLKTRTLWFPTALHASWNFFQGCVYSFPVSGLDLKNRSLFVLEQSGPDWVTGGAYGPEAGALTTVVLLFAIVFIIRSHWVRLSEGRWLPPVEPLCQVEPVAQES